MGTICKDKGLVLHKEPMLLYQKPNTWFLFCFIWISCQPNKCTSLMVSNFLIPIFCVPHYQLCLILQSFADLHFSWETSYPPHNLNLVHRYLFLSYWWHFKGWEPIRLLPDTRIFRLMFRNFQVLYLRWK